MLSKQLSHHGTPLSSGTQGVSLSAGRLRKVRATQLSETGQRRYALIPPFLTIPTHFYGAPGKYKVSNGDLNSHSGYLPPSSFFVFTLRRVASRAYAVYALQSVTHPEPIKLSTRKLHFDRKRSAMFRVRTRALSPVRFQQTSYQA